MTLKPIGPRLVVQYRKPEQKKGALIIPNEEQPQFATVVSISKDTAGHCSDLAKGDLVGIHRHAAHAFKVDDEIFHVVEMKDVIAKLEQSNET